jgi:hypothetical protein
VPNNRVAEGEKPASEAESLLVRIKNLGNWGFLPPKAKEEMLNSSAKEVPAEYREIIERYYKKLSDFYGREEER